MTVFQSCQYHPFFAIFAAFLTFCNDFLKKLTIFQLLKLSLKTNLPNIKSSLSAYRFISLQKTSIIFQTGLSGLKNRFDKRRRTWRDSVLGNTRRSVSLMKEKRWDESEEDSTKSAPTAIFTFNLSGKYAGTSTYN